VCIYFIVQYPQSLEQVSLTIRHRRCYLVKRQLLIAFLFVCYIFQLEYRQQEDLDELRQKLTKQFDARQTLSVREIESHLQQQAKERERAQHAAVVQEAKRRRHIQQNHEQELKQLLQQQKKDYQKNKDDLRKVLI